MNCERSISIIIVIGIVSTWLVGTPAISQTKQERGMSVLKGEMLALEEAFETIIDAVIFENMELIKPVIPPLHEAREKVEKAIKAGRKIILPKNQDKFEEFVELDKTFHKDFESIEMAAEAGEKKVVQDQTHKLFDACVVCHETFRK